jgi:dihydrodipicolinate synthase/N-acetylneuraminate lyase
MDRGAEAYMPTLYHDVYARIWNLHRAGKREQAIALYYRLLPCLAFAAGHKAIKHQIKKAVLHAEGVFATRAVRASERPPDAIEARLLDEICDYGRALEKQG